MKIIRRSVAVAAFVAALSASSAVAQEADLSITKLGPSQAPAGSNVAYNISIVNLGPDAAAAVTLNDVIPPGMTFVSATQTSGPAFLCSDPGAGNNGPVTCTAATLLPGQPAEFVFTFNIPPGTAPNTTFTNIATIASQTPDPGEENNSSTAGTSTPPPPQADLAVTKTAPSFAAPNSNVPFTITLTNIGPGASANVSLQDTLPGDATFVSLGQSGTPLNCTTPAIGAGGTVTCTAASYPANGTTTFTLTMKIGSTGTYTNTATVTATNDPNVEENNVASTSVQVSAVDVSVNKVGPATVNAGANLTYTITVANHGPEPASGVNLIDQLPPGTTFVSLVRNSGPAPICSTPPPAVECTFETLAVGASTELALMINAGNTTAISNTARVTVEGFDPNAANNESTVNTTVTQLANLVVTKTGPATATAGTNITYSITLTNNGPSSSQNVVLNDLRPDNTSLVSLTQTSGPAFNCSNLTCTTASMPAGSTATFTLVLQVAPSAPAGSTLSNTAQVTASTTDPGADPNSSTSQATVVTSADLTIAKSGPATVTAGTDVTYTVTVTNNGVSDAVNTTVTDMTPPNTTFVSATQTSGPPFTCTGGATISCGTASFPAGATASFQFVFRVSPSLASGSTISNTAQVSSPTPDPVPGNGSSTTPAAGVVTSADRGIVKTGPAIATAGSNVTYTITATNAGPSDAATFFFNDPLPPNTTFVSLNQTSGPTFNCTVAATITCSIATFIAGGSATFDLVLTVAPSATGTLENTATSNSTTPDPAPGNNSSTATTLLNPGPADVGIAKTVNGAMIATGANAVFTIVVTNNGPAPAAGVTVTDTLPPGTTLASATSTQGTCTGTTTVTCNVGTLASGSDATITLVVTLPQTPGPLTNTATVTIANADPNPANNSATTNFAAVLPSAVPTLSPFALALLAIAVATVGIFGMRLR